MSVAINKHKPIGDQVISIEKWTPQKAASNGEFEYIDIASVSRESKSIVETTSTPVDNAPSRARQIVKKNDVLVSTVRPNLNAVAVVPEELCGAIASTGFCVLRANPDLINHRYLYNWVRSPNFVDDMVRKSTGASYPAVSDTIIKSSKIPLPPLSEQKRIADILDKADTLRRKRREAIEKFETCIPSLFIEMFGFILNNSKGWPVVEFGQVCNSRLGKMLDAKQQTGKHPRPYLRNTNVQWNRFELTEVFEMDFDEADRQEFRLQNGDLLICEGGEVGRAAIWREELQECYFQKALHRVRPKPDMAVPEYILHFMWEMAKHGGFQFLTSQATIAHLTGVKLKQLPMPLPPLELQREFACRLSELEKAVSQSAAALQEADNLFNSLVQRAFKGKL